MSQNHIIFRFLLNGFITIFLGMAFTFIYGYGDPPLDMMEIRSVGSHLAKITINSAVFYFLIGLILTSQWETHRDWIAYSMIGLAAISNLVYIFVLVYGLIRHLLMRTPNLQLLFLLTLIIPIALNLEIIIRIRKNKLLEAN